MEKQNSVNPALLRAVEDASFAIYVIIGCIPDNDARECLADDWKKMLEVINLYMPKSK